MSITPPDGGYNWVLGTYLIAVSFTLLLGVLYSKQQHATGQLGDLAHVAGFVSERASVDKTPTS